MSGNHKKKSKKAKKEASWKEDEEYVVERILKKRMESGEPQYYVKWKDRPHSSNTWEPVSKFSGSEILEEFERSRNLANSSGLAKKKTKLDVKKDSDESPSAYDTDESSSVYDSDVETVGSVPGTNFIDDDVLEECPLDRDPEEVLGVVPINKIITYLVKWKPKTGTGGAAVEPDLNLVRSDAFKYIHPEVVINFYEKHIGWTKDDRAKIDIAKDSMMELDKAQAMIPDPSVFPQSVPRVENEEGERSAADVSSSSEQSERDSDEDDPLAMEVDPTIQK